MTTQLISAALERYAARMTSPESPALARLNRETHVKVEMAQMLSGPVQGTLLAMISKMLQPRCILELGTYTGYSAICLAQGLAPGGRLHTIDVNEELEDICRKYWTEAGVADRITYHTGKAAAIIPMLQERFDLVFIDADKVNYSLYFDLVIDLVPEGGWILADNVLFDGEVTLPPEAQSRNARAMHAFNEKVRADGRVTQLLLPVRDGIMIMQKTPPQQA